ncbi:MAG: PE-PPE domain-containing protein [Mycobacterium sp.]
MGTRRAVAAAMAVAVCGVVMAAAPAQATVAITVSGTRISHAPPYPEQLVPEFFVNDAITRIDYPAALFGMDRSIAVAVSGIVDAIATTPGPVVVAGFSQGAVAVARAKQSLMTLPAQQRPDPGRLTFVTVGDPSGPTGILRLLPVRIPVIGLTPVTAPETPYDTVTVNAEYDGWGDFPDRPGNLLSVANAMLGVAYIHGRYETVPGGLDVSTVPERNITTTTNSLGGHTTSYLIPTGKLPLVQPLRDLGVPEQVVAAIEKPLKARVDAGYRRNDAPAAASAADRYPIAKARAGQRHSRSVA